MKSDFLLAVTQLANERHLPREMVLGAVEAALASAYKKESLMAGQDITVKLEPGTGEVKVYVQKHVVEAVTDANREMALEEARFLRPQVQVGDVVEVEAQLPSSAGRIAAQTAKQVVLQRLREAERDQVYAEYADRVGDILAGQVQRFEANHQVILDVGRGAEAVLPYNEQVPNERLRLHQRLRVYVLEVQRTSRGPGIIVSRSHKDLLRRLMELEVPEIYSGIVEIKAIAREPGSRSKVAVVARQDGVDAVGSCVGMRGNRIQNIVKELQEERIDVIQWHRDPTMFIANALSPAQVLRVELDEGNGGALVVVPDRYLSLAIGREGQNARLAAKVTGWRIDIKGSSEVEAARLQKLEAAVAVPEAVQAEPEPVAQVLEEVAALEAEEGVPVALVEVREAAEADVQAVPAEEAAEVTTSMTIEEELALQSVEEELAGQEVDEDEPPGEELDEEEIWEVPRITTAPSGIRFAEDILGPRGQRGKRRRGDRGDDEKPRKSRKERATKPGGTSEAPEEE